MSQLSSMMEQVRKIKNGLGVQHLLDEAYRILGNPIALFNTEYNLIAYTACTTDDPLWNELVTCGTFCKETQELFYSEGFVEDMANTPNVSILTSSKLKYGRICGKVFSKNNNHVSNLIVVACNRELEAHDTVAFEAICRLMSREISRSSLFQEYEQAHEEMIIRNLLDGTHNARLDMGQIGILYDTLESSLYVVVVDSSCSDPAYDGAHYRDLLKQAGNEYKYALYKAYIVIIISTNKDSFQAGRELSGLIKALNQHNMYAGISSRFENLLELEKYYAQALDAMEIALNIRSSQRIFPCDESSMEKMEQIRALSSGKGIQYFLDIGPDIFANPLLFHDMELNLLAYSQHMEISDPIWEELITYGTSSDETIQLFKTEGFINTMENTKGGALLVSEKIKYDRISWKIYSHDSIMIGCLSIVNTMNPFSEDELVLFGAFSQRFSREVEKIDFYNHYGRVYSGTVINRLLSGKIDNYTFYSEDIGNLYGNLMDNLFLAVVDTRQYRPEQVNLTYIRELLTWPGMVNRYALYAEYIVIILSTDSAPLGENSELHRISSIFEQHNIYAGISSCCNNIYDLPQFYVEAVEALTEGLKNRGPDDKQRLFQFGSKVEPHNHIPFVSTP